MKKEKISAQQHRDFKRTKRENSGAPTPEFRKSVSIEIWESEKKPKKYSRFSKAIIIIALLFGICN